MVAKNFTGPKAEVDQEIDLYFRRYPAAGYDTRVAYYIEKGGVVTALVTRLSSCD